MGLYGANAPNFCVSFLLRLLFSLKCRNQNYENPYQNHQTKNERVTKKYTYVRKIMLHFLKFLQQGSCFASVQYGILMIKYCRLIVLICVSVVLSFHKCLRLLRLGLYTVSTPRVDNDAPIVAHICYISFLRCNYYDEYLACEQEDFCERYIKFKGNWELLSGERLAIL